jgi:hypothetical protein
VLSSKASNISKLNIQKGMREREREEIKAHLISAQSLPKIFDEHKINLH